MIQISEIAQAIKPSPIRRLFNLAKQFDDVVDFTLGDPDVHPHQKIKDAASSAIQTGKTRYSQNAGLLELRKTVTEYYKRKEGFVYNPESECIITVGAMEGLYLALLAMLNEGDEVIIPAPYYVNYLQMVQMCKGYPVIVDKPDCGEELSFDVSDVEKAITHKTKAIIINTPSNPSGRVISQKKIAQLAELAKRYDLTIISDEVYKCLMYDGVEFKSIVAIDGMRERTVLVNSLSKEFCMTGYRVGYVLAPQEIVAAMTKLQENVAACAPLPSQYAAIEALSGREDYSAKMVSIFTKRRDILVDGIQSIKGLSCKSPQATFYLMVNISSTGMSSEEFALDLLEKVHVAVVPGFAYGQSCDKYIRIAFTLDEDKIREGVKRIAKYMDGK